MSEIKPILVIGINRSGTKWISNILSNHSDIISVKFERGGGIQETNMFDVFPKAFGDLSHPDNYVALIECWSQTDFFKLAQADKELYYKINPRPNNYFELFRIFMNDLANRNQKRFWLQKTNPFNGLNCRRYYSHGHFLVIKRNIIDTLKSQIKQSLNRGDNKKRILKEIFFYVYQEKYLNKIIKSSPVTVVEYEALRNNLDAQIKRICDRIGIEFQRAMLQVPFKKNTSFKSDSERNEVISSRDAVIIKLCSILLSKLPLLGFYLTHSMFRKKGPRLLPGTFGLIKDKYGIR